MLTSKKKTLLLQVMFCSCIYFYTSNPSVDFNPERLDRSVKRAASFFFFYS